MTPLTPTSASELLTSSTSVPVGASSMMVVWKVEEVKTGTLSFTSSTRTVTVPVPLRDGEPERRREVGKKRKEKGRKKIYCDWQWQFSFSSRKTKKLKRSEGEIAWVARTEAIHYSFHSHDKTWTWESFQLTGFKTHFCATMGWWRGAAVTCHFNTKPIHPPVKKLKKKRLQWQYSWCNLTEANVYWPLVWVSMGRHCHIDTHQHRTHQKTGSVSLKPNLSGVLPELLDVQI